MRRKVNEEIGGRPVSSGSSPHIVMATTWVLLGELTSTVRGLPAHLTV